MKELNIIQTRLVATKNATNDFGHYKYRSLESIMECLKPLLKETECTITFNDDLVCIEGRIFVKSTAILKNKDGETETSTSFAELDNHKGMSREQSTGSSSSYARKYAACSLLAIDDNQDVDSMDNRGEEKPVEKPSKLSVEECTTIVNNIAQKASNCGQYDTREVERWRYGKIKWLQENNGFTGDLEKWLREKFKEKFAA